MSKSNVKKLKENIESIEKSLKTIKKNIQKLETENIWNSENSNITIIKLKRQIDYNNDLLTKLNELYNSLN